MTFKRFNLSKLTIKQEISSHHQCDLLYTWRMYSCCVANGVQFVSRLILIRFDKQAAMRPTCRLLQVSLTAVHYCRWMLDKLTLHHVTLVYLFIYLFNLASMMC